ncbi:MAG TPA: GDP-mannose 4,6-dehydratase [Acidimicrobiales bacterium]
MSRVVVTGGAGFLGSHVCDALLDRGDEVVAIDNLLTGTVTNVEHLFGRSGFTLVQHDVSQFIWVPGLVDAVLHFASPASPADYLDKPIQTLKVGSLGTHNGLGLAKAKGARFLLASTSEVYGDPQVHPQPESYWGHVNPIGPRGVYDEAKRFAEAITMAYHRYHDLDVRIVRIFNSVLADEQVLYDDGRQLRREPIGDLAARIGSCADLEGYRVPAFGPRGRIRASAAVALVGHPPTGRCFEVRTRYGRSIRVTGDHSLFVEGADGSPSARAVTSLAVGDRIAIAGSIDVPERDRVVVSVIDAWEHAGRSLDELQVTWPGLGWEAWRNRRALTADRLEHRQRAGHSVRNLGQSVTPSADSEMLTVAEVRRLGLDVPDTAMVRRNVRGHSHWLPASLVLTDDVLWLLGLYVAEGTWHRSPHDAFISIACDQQTLERAGKICERDLWTRAPLTAPDGGRTASMVARGQLLLAVLDHLGFGGGPKSIPGWVLGLPLHRLKWFLEGYREGDGVHSGKKLVEGQRHEFSTTSAALKDDLIVALGRFGMCPSVGRYETTFKQRTGDRRYPFWRVTVANVQPWSPLEWDGGVHQKLNARRCGDLVWATVTAIEEVPGTDLVYDFCVPGRENFWAGSGILAHNTYGPRMRAKDGRVVSNFLVQALQGKPLTIYGDGSQTRSFCYVDDEVRGILALLDGDVVGPVNVGNPAEFTVRELADIVLEVTGARATIAHEPLPVDDPVQRQPDITLARTALGWEPRVELREGLRRTADWFRRTLG